MTIQFDQIPVTVIPNMKGGEKEMQGRIFQDSLNKIIEGRLIPGATIGMHTHETSSEVIHILSGKGKVICDGETEILSPGMTHYCPKGHTHSLINDSDDGDLIFLAVVPEQ